MEEASRQYAAAIQPLLEKNGGNVEKALETINGGVRVVPFTEDLPKTTIFIGMYEYDGLEVFLLLENKENPKFLAVKQPQLRDMNA